MPPNFTKPLAWRLDSMARSCRSRRPNRGDVLKPNHVYIAPGGNHLILSAHGRTVKAVVEDGPPGQRPQALGRCADEVGRRNLRQPLPGRHHDRHGPRRRRRLRPSASAGGYVLGQDEASSDVYGMNKVAFVEGRVDRQFALDDAANLIMLTAKRLWQPQPVGA